MKSWWGRNFLVAEFGLSAAITVGFAIWAWGGGGWPDVDNTLKDNRTALYSVLASVFGALLGFVIATASIVLGFVGTDRLTVVRESRHYPTLWKAFTAAIRATGFATLVALVGLIVDRNDDPSRAMLTIAIFATTLAVFRMARCIWILENVIRLVTVPTGSSQT